MAAVESPASYPESPMDEGDAVYPCKGCGEILEEGKAFELAGNRWHIDCFRCNTCGTLLDSDANLLLLGDGSLICNNCTYSCNACGNKIEDLAILTGDQAFCAACFRCRNCKRKIENLRYARTSQGIFCMRCHESLMERRRKKGKSSKASTPGTGTSGPVVLDKSLPALPPNANPPATFDSSSMDDEKSPRSTQPSRFGTDNNNNNQKRDVSPMPDERNKENLTLPASTYREGRISSVSSAAASDFDDDQGGFLPMAFDPNPPSSNSMQMSRRSDRTETETPRAKEVNNQQRDYFNTRTNSKSNHREMLRDGAQSRSASSEREKPTSPHIAQQDKGRLSTRKKEAGEDVKSSTTSPPHNKQQPQQQQRPQMQQASSTSYSLGQPDGFKLQDAPRTRKGSMRSEKFDTAQSQDVDQSLETKPNYAHSRDASGMSPRAKDVSTPDSDVNPFDDPKLQEAHNRHPARGDSLTASGRKPVATAPEPSGSEGGLSASQNQSSHLRSASTVSATGSTYEASRTNGQGIESPSRSNMEIPPHAASRPSAPSKSVANGDFIAPRAAPPAPPSNGHDRRNESVTSFHSADPVSPSRGHFHKPSLGADFSMDEEMSRIIGRKDSTAGESASSMLRRVSNAVRHGRSFSDKTIPLTQRTPTSTTHLEISSPLNPSNPASPAVRDDVESLKAHLRRAQQRIAELESDKMGLQETMNTSGELKQVNNELQQKRSTMAFLDTQREMVVRELEVMTEHLTRAKDTNRPLDIAGLKTDILQDFAHSLQRLKDSFGSQIEDLVHRRNELTDDIANLIQVKDKGLQEFESLSSKNTQLNELNSQLVHNIQEMYKANKVPNGNSMIDLRSGSQSNISHEISSLSSAPNEGHEAGEAHAILTAPQVVNIRKGQPKRFNWKKGGRDVAKNITRGMKGAFVKDGQYDINGMPIGPPQAMSGAPSSADSSRQGSSATDGGRGGLGFFGQKNGLKPGQLGTQLKNSSSSNLLGGNDPSMLFGSDLVARTDLEKRMIPAIVTRCIDEVEERGMDAEGVYRKSGGSGQVKMVQAGFEKDGNFDISDPDLDIHAVTSCLKQYFRKLPNPLITYDAYEGVLEAVQVPEEMRGVALKAAIGNLPPVHRDVLEYLIGHLARVVEKETQNLMTPLNLAVVFAPTIMRPSSIEREMTDMQAQRDVVRGLLEYRATVFD
ncbi:RhoGAP domain-containing protein 1 [Elsinoe australis]|uniref:RhoGAP domain-containing protein 1 n=1 Tax=Elsinoe australis TaxID=40998 RepID=A0A4U7B4J1_9PEZI|nr:RhoGAP domain-containing protein 1 [Elsinoe australis]